MRLQEEPPHIWERRGVSVVIVTHDIEEAPFLADRVVVMDSRPGRVVETLSVDGPCPRDRNGSGVVELKRPLLTLLAAKHEGRPLPLRQTRSSRLCR